jgi:hypothetical protein
MLASKILGIKRRIDNYIDDNSDEIGFKLIEKLAVNHYCCSAGSYEDFMNYCRSNKKLIIILTYNILM